MAQLIENKTATLILIAKNNGFSRRAKMRPGTLLIFRKREGENVL
jgi:hypothetical protein